MLCLFIYWAQHLFCLSVCRSNLSTHHRHGVFGKPTLLHCTVPAPVVYPKVVQRYRTCPYRSNSWSLTLRAVAAHAPIVPSITQSLCCDISSLFAPSPYRYFPSSFISNWTATAAAKQSFPAHTAMRRSSSLLPLGNSSCACSGRRPGLQLCLGKLIQQLSDRSR